MRVSIINCVSTAAEMMRFSDESLFLHAQYDDFDYVIVTWLASPKVERYLEELPEIALEYCPNCKIHVVKHETNPDVGFVPNLRAMMNDGFDYGFELNDFAGLINTDCYFAGFWLDGLVKNVHENRVINSLHITAASPPQPVTGIITENLGEPLPNVFNVVRFHELWREHFDPASLILASELNGPSGYRECATMPYLFHRKYWERCGPWELQCIHGQSPDVRFFDRVARAGAEFALTKSSVVYHHEAVERRGKRPHGAEYLPEE